MKLGFLKRVRVKRDQPHWLTDEEDKRIGLKITDAGSAAIGVGDDCKGEEQPGPEPKRRAKKAAEPEELSARPARLAAGRSAHRSSPWRGQRKHKCCQRNLGLEPQNRSSSEMQVRVGRRVEVGLENSSV